jgi:peptidoglycan-associated lipoprotein
MKGLVVSLLLAVAILNVGADTPKKLLGRVVNFKHPQEGVDAVEVLAYDKDRTKLIAKALTDGAGDYILEGLGIGDEVLIEHRKPYYLNDPQEWKGVIKESTITVKMSRIATEAAYYLEMGEEIVARVSNDRGVTFYPDKLGKEWRAFREFNYLPEQRGIVKEAISNMAGELGLLYITEIDAEITALEVKDKDPGTATEIARREGFAPDVYFPYDEAELSAETKMALKASAVFLRVSDFRLTIEGHADSRGTNEYNMALGDRRAESVRTYLAGEGISSDRLRIISYGEELPVCTEENEACYAQNRSARLTLRRIQ